MLAKMHRILDFRSHANTVKMAVFSNLPAQVQKVLAYLLSVQGWVVPKLLYSLIATV
jgi:hypothetical protein